MICIMCALDVEYNNIKKYFNICKEIKKDEFCQIAECNNKQVIIVKSGIGKSLAYKYSKYIIEKYGHKTLFLSAGIAGAIAPELNIGDVVISNIIVDCIKSEIVNEYSFNKNIIGYFSGLKNGSNINLHIGKVICNDEIINNNHIKQNLYTKSQALCVEMESTGVAQNCSEGNIPFAAFKIISDLADGKAVLSMLRTQHKVTDKLGLFLSKYIILLQELI